MNNDQPEVVLTIMPPFGPEGPPLGLACITAALRQAGVRVQANDDNIRLFRQFENDLRHLWHPAHKSAWVWESRLPGTIAGFGDAFDAIADRLAASGAKIAGFSVHSDNRGTTIDLLRRLRARRPEMKTMIGGLGVFSRAGRDAFPKNLVDFFVVGEGETTVVEAVRATLAGRPITDIPGVALPGDEGIARRPAATLDAFPIPDFSDFDLQQYSTPNLPLAMSRGCTKGCTLCNDRVLMGRFRKRTAESVFTEIKHHSETLGIADFMIVDLQITQIIDEVVRLAEMIAQAGLDIRWNANAAVSEDLTPTALQALRRGGCTNLTLGVESGSDHVLRLMNKGTTAQAAANTLQAVKDAGITCWVNLVVGFPGETADDLAETQAWIETHRAVIDEVAVLNACNILDHSLLAEKPKKYGVLAPVDPDWFEVAWVGKDGNTPQERRARLTRVRDLLVRLGIPVRQTNLDFIDEADHLAGQDHDVLLVLCPPFDVTHPPLALAAVASYLAARGWKSFALDLSIQEYIRAVEEHRRLWDPPRHDQWADPRAYAAFIEKLGLSPVALAEQILTVKSEVIYFHLVRGNLLLTRDVMREIRAKDSRRLLLIGGEPTRIGEERDLFPEAVCDLAVLGEPEETIAEILRRQQRSGDRSFLRGARWIDERGEPRYLPREPLRELDKIGHPTFREFSPKRYASPVLPIRMSRGCRFRCAFCAEQPMEGSFRTRSGASVFAEMCHHHDVWEVFTFRFTDLIVNSDLDVLADLGDRIVRSGRPFKWSGQAAPRGDMTPAFFAKLAAAGCTMLRFGVESFSDPLLERMNKTYRAADAIANLRHAHAAGIETHVNLLLGFPGESEKDFLATAKALYNHQDVIDYVDEVSPCYVLPGSALERDCTKYEVLLPPGDHHRVWSYKAYNNDSWRAKRAAEMAIWTAGLNIKFNYDFFIAPGHPFRKIEEKIRSRLAKKISPAAEVALVTMPPWGFENPPVGLAYLSTYLRARGIHTRVLDYNIRFYNGVHEIYRMLWHVENKNFWSNDDTFAVICHALRGLLDEAVEELVELAPPLLGFSVVDPKERLTIEIIKRYREHNKSTRIILGGPACFTPEYRQIFIDRAGDLIDGYAVGEGEETLLEAAQRVAAGEALNDIPGLLIRDAQGECRLTVRPPIADLDSVPAPTYDEFDHTLYPGDSLIVEWSRGCIGNCTYCKGKQISGDYRRRSARHIFEELKRHHDRHGYRRFTVSDNLFNGDLEMLEELCDRLIDAKLNIRWNAEGIPLPGMTHTLLEKVAAAGCEEIQWGLESASPKILKAMGKSRHFTVEQAQRVLRDSHEAGIKTCLFIIVGFPGETEADFALTKDFLRTNAAWIDQVKSINALHIITGTPVHLHPEQFGLALPKIDYHYLWKSTDGVNTPAVRNRRIRELLALCRELPLEVRETNLTEGKQHTATDQFKDPTTPIEAKMKLLIDQINDLRSFETESEEYADAFTATAEPEAPAETVPPPTPATDEERGEFLEQNLALAGVTDGEQVFAGPELLEIDLTNFCNLDCVGCWNHSPLLGEDRLAGEEKQRRLPTELVLKLVDDAARLGARRVQLSGAGDPLCHPDALAIIERIKQHRLECTLITNGTLLTDSVCHRLVEIGLDHLTVSVWAGTPEIYTAVHPNQKTKTLLQLKKSLQRLHERKAAQKTYKPQVKIYNVICHRNAADLSQMITFAVEALAEHVEFTPIDIVPGRTDELALTAEDRATILRQLNDLPKREDYLELDPTRGGRTPDADGEGLEFARFVKKSILPPGFRYELDDITRFDALCPRKEWRLDVREDNEVENALLFYYPPEECCNCPDNPTCAIDKDRFTVKVEFLSFLGYGAFLRRIRSGATTGMDAGKVEEIPCAIGWTYARVKTDGSVIPCCKADDLPLGNLYRNDLQTIWTSPAYARFRHTSLTTPKSDPYFAPIDCYAACDNLGHNLATRERLAKMTTQQLEWLRQAAESSQRKIK